MQFDRLTASISLLSPNLRGGVLIHFRELRCPRWWPSGSSTRAVTNRVESGEKSTPRMSVRSSLCAKSFFECLCVPNNRIGLVYPRCDPSVILRHSEAVDISESRCQCCHLFDVFHSVIPSRLLCRIIYNGTRTTEANEKKKQKTEKKGCV